MFRKKKRDISIDPETMAEVIAMWDAEEEIERLLPGLSLDVSSMGDELVKQRFLQRWIAAKPSTHEEAMAVMRAFIASEEKAEQ